MSYKAKYMKARDRYYEHTSKNEELKNELSHICHNVRELKSEIKMLINTILEAAPELEPSMSSDDFVDDEGLDQDIQESLYNTPHRDDVPKNTRDDLIDRAYYSQQADEYAHEHLNSRSAAPKELSPHFRHSRMNPASYSPTLQRSGREPNGRNPHQSSRRKYEEVDNFYDNDEPDSHDYGDDSALSPYGAPLQDDQDQGSYYEDHSRPSPSSRHRSSHRSGEASGYHPYQQPTRQVESRHRSNGNGHHRAPMGTERSVSPDGRYPNTYAHRSHRS